MEKRTKIIIGVSVGIVALVGAYFIFRPKGNGTRTTESGAGQYSSDFPLDDDGVTDSERPISPTGTTSSPTGTSTTSEWDDKSRRGAMRDKFKSNKGAIKDACGGRRFGGSDKDIAWYECVKGYSGFSGYSGFQSGSNYIEVDTNLTDLD